MIFRFEMLITSYIIVIWYVAKRTCDANNGYYVCTANDSLTSSMPLSWLWIPLVFRSVCAIWSFVLHTFFCICRPNQSFSLSVRNNANFTLPHIEIHENDIQLNILQLSIILRQRKNSLFVENVPRRKMIESFFTQSSNGLFEKAEISFKISPISPISTSRNKKLFI